MKIALVFIMMATLADAFFQTAKKVSTPATSPLAEEAAEIFFNKYPFRKEIKNVNPLGNIGMPDRDIDGTRYKKTAPKAGERRSLADISEDKAKTTFSGIAKIYGEDEALEMVKIFPLALAFDEKKIAEVFGIWSELFGEEETKGMVLRNPALLAVGPELAKKTDKQTMQFSYIVAATRPIGIFGPIGIVGLLCVPAIEAATGVAISEPVRAALTGGF